MSVLDDTKDSQEKKGKKSHKFLYIFSCPGTIVWSTASMVSSGHVIFLPTHQPSTSKAGAKRTPSDNRQSDGKDGHDNPIQPTIYIDTENTPPTTIKRTQRQHRSPCYST